MTPTKATSHKAWPRCPTQFVHSWPHSPSPCTGDHHPRTAASAPHPPDHPRPTRRRAVPDNQPHPTQPNGHAKPERAIAPYLKERSHHAWRSSRALPGQTVAPYAEERSRRARRSSRAHPGGRALRGGAPAPCPMAALHGRAVALYLTECTWHASVGWLLNAPGLDLPPNRGVSPTRSLARRSVGCPMIPQSPGQGVQPYRAQPRSRRRALETLSAARRRDPCTGTSTPPSPTTDREMSAPPR
jgi:hypothetical protein